MPDETINQKIAEFITAKILAQPKRVLLADEPLISAGIIDSFSLIDLALFVEDNFGVRIADSELNSSTFDSLDQLSALILARQAK